MSPSPTHGDPSRSLPRRTQVALSAGRLAGAVSRRLGRGSGVVVRGRIALAVDPGALRRLAGGRRSVIVTGTNGKSTTTKLVVAALETLGPVATNSTGANMAPGILTALDDSAATLAVLEADELHVPAVAGQTIPSVVIALNLSRDQLDRTHEVSKIAQVWARSFAQTPGVRVVANAADPHVADAAWDADPIWVNAGVLWTDDAGVCPRCGEVLTWAAGNASWSSGCGFAMPEADYTLTGRGVRLPDGREIAFDLALPGEINRGNAVFALAAAIALGADADEALAQMRGVREVDGRYAVVELSGRRAPLMLAKNPAGWAAALTMIPNEGALIIGINARIADGTDTSWLYDVPFEVLAGRVVGATGDRRDDLAVRLHYAGAIPVVSEDPVALAERLPAGELTVAANYTAFRELRRYLVDPLAGEKVAV